MNKLDFYLIHLLPHPALLTGVDQPVYEEYLEELVAGERLGYDGLWIYEDGNGKTSLRTQIAAQVATRTEGIPIGVVGDAPPLHSDPLRVAEEIAKLDVGSNGRAIAGFVRGTGTEQQANGARPSYSQERFWEMHDLVVKAWTTPGPFCWHGTHYELPHVNPSLRPRQRPHPPVWLAGTRSFETIEKAAERRYTFMTTFAPQWLTRASFDMYRRAADRLGYEPSPRQLATVVPTYVSETEEQAHREARQHLMCLFENRLKDYRELTYEELLDERYVIVGSPETVIERLTELSDDVGAGIVLGAGGRMGSMPHEMVMKNTRLFAEEVIPHFRSPGGRPTWLNGDRAEVSASNGRGELTTRSHRALVHPEGGFAGATTKRIAEPAGRPRAIASFTATGLARRCGGNGA